MSTIGASYDKNSILTKFQKILKNFRKISIIDFFTLYIKLIKKYCIKTFPITLKLFFSKTSEKVGFLEKKVRRNPRHTVFCSRFYFLIPFRKKGSTTGKKYTPLLRWIYQKSMCTQQAHYRHTIWYDFWKNERCAFCVPHTWGACKMLKNESFLESSLL